MYETFNHTERLGKIATIRTLVKRFVEAESEDALIAFKHVYRHRHPQTPFEQDKYTRFEKESNRSIIRPQFPYRMAVRMLLNVVDLNRGCGG